MNIFIRHFFTGRIIYIAFICIQNFENIVSNWNIVLFHNMRKCTKMRQLSSTLAFIRFYQSVKSFTCKYNHVHIIHFNNNFASTMNETFYFCSINWSDVTKSWFFYLKNCHHLPYILQTRYLPLALDKYYIYIHYLVIFYYLSSIYVLFSRKMDQKIYFHYLK